MNEPLQRTEQWFKDREGKLTCSQFGQAAGLGPGSRQQLWRRIMKIDTFEGNTATQWGEANEPVALQAYRQQTQTEPSLVGFVPHPSLEWIGGSPDFLVGDDGVGEIKCPFSQKLYDDIPPYYMAQVQGLLQCTNREWCDFVVWTPQVVSTTRVLRSDEYWNWLHVRLADFWSWVVAEVEPPRDKKPTKIPHVYTNLPRIKSTTDLPRS